MNTPEDLLRSVRKWFGMVLPEPWDVQYQRTDALQRPAAIVQPATPQVRSGGSAYIHNNQRDFEAFVYPVGTEGDPMSSRIEAEGIGQSIGDAMRQGVMLDARIYYSRALRLPVFDYAGIAWDQALAVDAVPYDFLPVNNFSTEVRVDPDDDALFTVVVDMRLSWSSHGDTSRFIGPLIVNQPVTKLA